jgi:uncharacterized membrane protein YedE/YeeE
MMHSSLTAPLLGGLLIGVAVAMLLWSTGRVAGVSGILAGVVRPERGEWGWRLSFIAGLVVGGGIARLAAPQTVGHWDTSLPLLALAGGLVGFGTQMAGGCTSGHGVCGVSRLSRRSLAATATFMTVAALVVFGVRHVHI